MRFLRRSLTGMLLLATTVALLTLAAADIIGALRERAARDTAPREAAERVFAANVVAVTPQRIAPVLTTSGEIRSRRTLEVRAAASGRVAALGEGVEEGGQIARGQVLVRIDPTEAETALAVARTDLQDVEAELRDARRGAVLAADDLASARAQAALRTRALDRQRDLERRGVGTALAVETAELAAAAADQAVLSRRQAEADALARVDQAATERSRRRIAVEEAQRRLDETEMRAAFDGVLSDVVVVEGGLVSVNERLMQLVDPMALEIAFRVSTAQYVRLLDADGSLVAAEIAVSLDAGGVPIETTGTISRAGAVVGEGQTGRRLYARLAAPAGFRPGDFATVAIAEPPIDGLARLPAAAVAADGSVLVLGEDQRLRLAAVELVRRQGDEVLVRAPDLAGREVVARRAPQLGAGIKVRPSRPVDREPAAEDMLELTEERRARLVAFVEASDGMPETVKARVLGQLRESRVPAQVVERIEQRIGG